MASTVHIVEDDEGLAQSIARILCSLGYKTETYSGADDFLSRYSDEAPCCILVDLLLPGITGLKLWRECLRRKFRCAFVMISGNGDVPSAVEAMHLGAVDFLEKPFSHQRLLTSVNLALNVAKKNHECRKVEDDASDRLASLSSRERQIFDAMAEGLVSKEIAKRYGISPRTVDVHRSRIMEKLQIQSPTQLAHLMAVVERLRAKAIGT